MERSLIFLSSFSVFPLQAASAIALAKACRYDGVELFLHRRDRPQILNHLRDAQAMGLRCTMHQFWSYAESPTLLNACLQALGYTEPEGYSLNGQVPPKTRVPTVIYAERIPESLQSRLGYDFRVQTCSLDANGASKLPYERFVQLVRKYNLPVCFDIQHALEYLSGKLGVEHLPDSPDELMSRLKRLWSDLGPYVKEIHLTDCHPRAGKRNVFPGDGLLPLFNFFGMLRELRWHGDIVPEVSPVHLFPYRFGAARLRAHVQKLVEGRW